MLISNTIHELDAAAERANKGMEESQKMLDFFRGQLEKIIVTKQALSAIEDINLNIPPPSISGLPVEAKAKKPREKKAPAPEKKADDLPHTKSDFWLGLITDKPQKTGEILNAACSALGITDKEQRAKLKGRQTFNLQKFIDEGKIKSEGEQTNRTYFL